MKSLWITSIVLLIAIHPLHTEQKELGYDSTPKKIKKVINNPANKQTQKQAVTPTNAANTEEPAGALNQAGNVILPAVKMFQ